MMQRTTNPIIHRLQQTLETHAPREEVAEALAEAEKLGDELPELLAFRARERIDVDRFLSRRRIMFGVACSLFVFVSLFSAVGLTTVMRLRLARRDASVLQQWIADEQWDEAQAFLETLDPATRARPEFVQGEQTIRDAFLREQQRKSEFETLVAELRSDPSAEIEDETVARLDELAVTAEERAVAAEMSARADEQRLRRETGRLEGQTQQFEQLQSEVEEFFEKESSELDDQARASRTRELQRRLQNYVSANHLSEPRADRGCQTDCCPAGPRGSASVGRIQEADTTRSSHDIDRKRR